MKMAPRHVREDRADAQYMLAVPNVLGVGDAEQQDPFTALGERLVLQRTQSMCNH